MRNAIASIFGAKQVAVLQHVSSVTLLAEKGSAADGGAAAAAAAADRSPFAIDGFISRPREGAGRRTGDRQYVYVNRRPVDFPRLTRLLNDQFCPATATSPS